MYLFFFWCEIPLSAMFPLHVFMAVHKREEEKKEALLRAEHVHTLRPLSFLMNMPPQVHQTQHIVICNLQSRGMVIWS